MQKVCYTDELTIYEVMNLTSCDIQYNSRVMFCNYPPLFFVPHDLLSTITTHVRNKMLFKEIDRSK